MKNQSLIYLTLCLVMISCHSGNNPGIQSGTESDQQDQEALAEHIRVSEYSTSSGKVFRITEDKSLGASLSKITVETMNFEMANDTFSLGETDPAEQIFLSDVDENGFEELYIVTRSAGSGSYGTLYGFASNSDKSVSPVYIPGIDDMNDAEKKFFEGFGGHNSFETEKGYIVVAFPIYREGDSQAAPTGGTRRIYYRLSAGEASWILKPVEIR